MFNAKSIFAIVFAALAISACGGGGGDDDEERAAFELLNAERDRCGFGTLAKIPQLDLAARGHADYQLLNDAFAHVQDYSGLGFTGERPTDRVAAAGYPNAGAVGDENVRFPGTDRKAGLGTRAVRDLLSAPYHLRGLMASYRDLGVAVRSSADVGSSARRVVVQVNTAYLSLVGPQYVPDGDVRTYPCDGTDNVNRQLRNESPNPIPNRDLNLQPLGPVVYVAGRQGRVLTISSASMVDENTGSTVTLREPVTAASDPYRYCIEGCFQPHEAYIAADAPLVATRRYRVTVRGTIGGVAFDRTFTFATGAGG